MLRDCPQSRLFWDSIATPIQPDLFYGSNLEEWLRINCASQQKSFSDLNWGTVLLFGVWSLWLWRNKVVFRDTSSQRPLKSDTIARATEFAFLGVNGKVKRPVVSVQVRWHPPPGNWYKLNSDGSSLGNPGRAGGGGLIRDANGAWVSGYARAIGHTTNVAAELWAIRDGINLCIHLNLTNVVFELDVKIVVDLILKDEGNTNDNDVIIADCKEGLRRIPRVRIQNCFREANKCANALTRRGAISPQDFVIYQSPPTDVAMLASLDAVGTLYECNRSLYSVF